MRNPDHRISDFTGEYVFMDSWDAAKFAEETGLEPLDSWEARSKISWWANGKDKHAALLRQVFLGSSSGPFHYGADRAIEDAFLIQWKLFKLPRVERQAVKVADLAATAPKAYVPPPAPPPSAETPPEKTWFEVKVVDEFGKPLDGLEVVFSQGSRQEKLETNGAGVVRWKDVQGSSTAWVNVANLATLREILKPRYAKAGDRKLPDGADVTKVMLGIDDPGKLLSSELPGILVIAKALTRVRLIGMHFDTNKCFLREPAMHGIRKVVSVYKANPTGKLLIVGHTDTVDTDAYNLDLSVERAEAVKAYLKDDVAAWEAWFSDGKLEMKRWGSREISDMIKALPCEKSVADFQHWSNDSRGTDLKVDGIAGPKTRRALIEAYMALDGTSLPKSIDAVVHGCGEFFPRKDLGDKFGKDGVKAEENRRVEMFCFDDAIQPPVPGTKATKGEPEYDKWNAQVTKNVDIGKEPYLESRVRLTDSDKLPMKFTPCNVAPMGYSQISDDEGWVHFEVPAGTEVISVEWRPEPGLTLVSEVRLLSDPDDSDDRCIARLRNLGFTGGNIAELTACYQQFFGREATGIVDDIRDELIKWHDGGSRPAGGA